MKSKMPEITTGQTVLIAKQKKKEGGWKDSFFDPFFTLAGLRC